MTKSSTLALAAALLTLAPGAASADGPGGSQPRAWVSGTGSDASTCGTIKAPCRTIQYAHDSVVSPGGTIYILDPANYVGTPPVTITHAISIINDGVGAATIVAPNADAIDIQANATDNVFIKGLILDGAGTGTNGIKVTQAGSLTVANCTIKGFGASGTGNGVFIAPTTDDVYFHIFDTIVSGAGAAGINALGVNNGVAIGTLRNVDVSNSAVAVSAGASAYVTVVDSVFWRNIYGVYVRGGGSLSVSNSALTSNSDHDLYNAGGFLLTYQNNVYTTTFGTITPQALH